MCLFIEVLFVLLMLEISLLSRILATSSDSKTHFRYFPELGKK